MTQILTNLDVPYNIHRVEYMLTLLTIVAYKLLFCIGQRNRYGEDVDEFT